MQIQALAQALDADVAPHLELEITGVAGMAEATTSEITFLSNPKYVAQLQDSQAAAILVASDFTGSTPMPCLRVAEPYLAFAKAIELFHHKPLPERRIHPTAILGEGVTLGENVSIGAYTVVGDQVTIGDHATLYPHCVVYDRAIIGAHAVLHSHAVVREEVKIGDRVILQNQAVIGADGFGFVPCADGTLYKIMQAGTVILDDDVEVQSLTAVDRGTIGVTRVGRGTKIDNLVQVGHGCEIGQHTLLCGMVGLAGSTKVGNHVMMGGRSSAAGHLTIGDRAAVGFHGTVLQSVEPSTQVCGYPAIDHSLWLRVISEIKKLPQLFKRLREVEKKIGL
ncbi:UDP-3-O-(3-hydroxymyristoyl)glucosamine N-acyltransferase [Acaryochloris thomasi RCC1774]|uniref:UDP-3-O-acylglucosamine N-acyltransferase n=2 Tax=Acaryochloris TaxID=155977 RepID=A0A2W1JBQ6_9CYAN|nr:UDP-3-O-(3-hydroxymyristoyl)glucosamine N-acyltransferase [Acaryochloris thomasi RCC1774]